MADDWQSKLRQAFLPSYQRLPASLRSAARSVFAVLQGPLLSARSRWVRDHYTAFGRQQHRQIFLEIARFANINRPIEGYYFEFGCHEANTMRIAYDCFHHLFDWQYVAFDSFEGLPEISAIDRQAIWEKGKLRTSEENFIGLCVRHGMPRGRLRTVRGFYDVSLTPELAASLRPQKAAVVYVDCDLYASTIPVLRFIEGFLQPGTVIVFDDWNCFLANPDRGERRAWREFLAERPHLRFEPFVHTGMQMSFVFVGRSDEPDPH